MLSILGTWVVSDFFFFLIVSIAAKNILVHVSFCTRSRVSVGHITTSRFAWSWEI